jgi:hypothetical protein
VLPPQCRTTLICREVNAHMRSRSNLKYFQFGNVADTNLNTQTFRAKPLLIFK